MIIWRHLWRIRMCLKLTVLYLFLYVLPLNRVLFVFVGITGVRFCVFVLLSCGPPFGGRIMNLRRLSVRPSVRRVRANNSRTQARGNAKFGGNIISPACN